MSSSSKVDGGEQQDKTLLHHPPLPQFNGVSSSSSFSMAGHASTALQRGVGPLLPFALHPSAPHSNKEHHPPSIQQQGQGAGPGQVHLQQAGHNISGSNIPSATSSSFNNLSSPYNAVKMESEAVAGHPPSSTNPHHGIGGGSSSSSSSSKLDANVFQAFHSFSQPSLTPFQSNYQTPSSYPSHYQGSSDLFESPSSAKVNTLNTQRSTLDAATIQSLQSRLVGMDTSKMQGQGQDTKLALQGGQAGQGQQGSAATTGASSLQQVNGGSSTSSAHPSQGQGQFAYDERFHALYEREMRWNEVRRYSEHIRRFASEAASHAELTKENFYDLYNMALLLLKSVDSLDPDKTKKMESASQYFSSQMPGAMAQNNALVAAQMGLQAQPSITDADLLNQRKSYEMYGRNQGAAFDSSGAYLGVMPKYATLQPDQNIYTPYPQAQEGMVGVNYAQVPMGGPFQPQGGYSKPPAGAGGTTPTAAEQKNFTGEVFFDDVGQGADGNRPKRRRRRTVYSTRRNLHCHMCGVTETPEWRRGPAGDHTLCNACGLHYAKSLKKQRKERDSRKHSIDMLLNESQPNITPPTSNPNLASSPAITNGNHSSPDSSPSDMTPPNEMLPPT